VNSGDVWKRTMIRRIFWDTRNILGSAEHCGYFIGWKKLHSQNCDISPKLYVTCSITYSLVSFPVTPKLLTLNGHFAVNSVLCRCVWRSEARFWNFATLKRVGKLLTEKNCCDIAWFHCDSSFLLLYVSSLVKLQCRMLYKLHVRLVIPKQ